MEYVVCLSPYCTTPPLPPPYLLWRVSMVPRNALSLMGLKSESVSVYPLTVHDPRGTIHDPTGTIHDLRGSRGGPRSLNQIWGHHAPCPLVQSTQVHKPITVHEASHACSVRVHTAQWLHLQVCLYTTTYPQVISMSHQEPLL